MEVEYQLWKDAIKVKPDHDGQEKIANEGRGKHEIESGILNEKAREAKSLPDTNFENVELCGEMNEKTTKITWT